MTWKQIKETPTEQLTPENTGEKAKYLALASSLDEFTLRALLGKCDPKYFGDEGESISIVDLAEMLERYLIGVNSKRIGGLARYAGIRALKRMLNVGDN